jgi:diguanylate cyclase (GGDEF)-like protein
MFSFLIQISKMGAIEQTIWNDSDDIDFDDYMSVYQLFAKDEKNALLKTIKRSSGRDDAIFCDTPLKFRDKPSSMLLCIMAINKKYLVFAAEYQASWDYEQSRGYQTIIVMFMNIIRSFMNKTASFGSKPQGKEQAEMIQTLVGELKTRKQLLEEANSKLNTINQDLNNRLVKDSLTGLVSRYQYRAEMEYLIGQNPGKLGIFVFIDIDNFKTVNDKYGHATGDAYLIEFSERLKALPVNDMVRMRISGDEFGLFIFGLEDCGTAVMDELWRMIQVHVLAKPIEANRHKLPISLSAGMSVYGRDTDEIYELIEFADHAMYTAKRKGKNRYCIYTN